MHRQAGFRFSTCSGARRNRNAFVHPVISRVFIHCPSPERSGGRMTVPELLDVPAVITTERLILRCPAPGDGQAWSEAVQASLPELRPWMEWAHQTPLDAQKYEVAARRAQADFLQRRDLVFLITDRHSGAVLGSCGIHRIHWALPKGDIGYFLDSRHVGRGLVTEAVAALTALALGPWPSSGSRSAAMSAMNGAVQWPAGSVMPWRARSDMTGDGQMTQHGFPTRCCSPRSGATHSVSEDWAIMRPALICRCSPYHQRRDTRTLASAAAQSSTP
ncbi:GNAT family N-acetyltransferase [Deinococcus malanensis]|uniref:GNAT family N-acetyltransferase n=1 Tax=Deinococcus malanensis TaxID=1706855 RepID=UPI00363A472D